MFSCCRSLAYVCRLNKVGTSLFRSGSGACDVACSHIEPCSKGASEAKKGCETCFCPALKRDILQCFVVDTTTPSQSTSLGRYVPTRMKV